MIRHYRDVTAEEIGAILASPADSPGALAKALGLSKSTVSTVRRNHTGQSEQEIRDYIEQRRQYDRVWRLIFEEARARSPQGASQYEFGTADQRRAQASIGNTGNTYDLKYYLKGRGQLPHPVQQEAPAGKVWLIRTLGKGRYAFYLGTAGEDRIEPDSTLAPIEIPNALPQIVEKYARKDEQALLARIRYNNLVGLFLGLSVYSLQSHWKTSIKGTGIPTEIDEVYVGVDADGRQCAICVEAKSKAPKETISAAQLIGAHRAASHQFGDTVIVTVAAKEIGDGAIAMMLLDIDPLGETAKVVSERLYRMVR